MLDRAVSVRDDAYLFTVDVILLFVERNGQEEEISRLVPRKQKSVSLEEQAIREA
ncbi:hypothetical protein WN55_10840 [Dufourea novaeangliae]|uniref:Uncharacterized protein n=1 Tax=Dufourea novaeangliae TaxID=178035 RepID=A0A154P9K1_DUFNO|nr:hypothetical protein WN55_10840 [Dufourea novaeangliae]